MREDIWWSEFRYMGWHIILNEPAIGKYTFPVRFACGVAVEMMPEPEMIHAVFLLAYTRMAPRSGSICDACTATMHSSKEVDPR
jgi:hypothetical protein